MHVCTHIHLCAGTAAMLLQSACSLNLYLWMAVLNLVKKSVASRRAAISFVWYHDPNLGLTSHLLCRDLMDGKISESSVSLRTQQLLLHDRCTCGGKKKKKRNAKAEVTAVLKCQISLRGPTWTWISKQWFSLVLLVNLHYFYYVQKKAGFSPQIKSSDTCTYWANMWAESSVTILKSRSCKCW